MNVTEILQFVDHLVFAKTDKHLNDLQKKIIEEVFKGKTYKQIAEFYDYDEGYIGDESRKIFKILSENLGENINKNNFCWTLERVINSNFINNFANNHFSFCTNHQLPNQETINQQPNKASYQDLIIAPQIIKFYNRESEFKTLSHWIFNQNNRLISILGLSGIGKTYLVKRFVDLNLEQFEVIIWKNLKLTPSLNQIIIEILNQYTECRDVKFYVPTEVCQFLNLLKEKRCLIIFDNVENIFIPGQFAGEYKPEYQDYQNFFKTIIETEHQSNLILISQEQSPKMQCLDEELYPVKCLELSGLDDVTSLDFWGLKDENSCLKLIELYQGNPAYLKSIAMTIRKNYDGVVREFLAENNLLITKDMQFNFNQLFNRLSALEQQIVLQLAKFEQPISREDLRQNLDFSSTDFSNALQSLQERYLVKKLNNNKILFDLDVIFKEYIKLTQFSKVR